MGAYRLENFGVELTESKPCELCHLLSRWYKCWIMLEYEVWTRSFSWFTHVNPKAERVAQKHPPTVAVPVVPSTVPTGDGFNDVTLHGIVGLHIRTRVRAKLTVHCRLFSYKTRTVYLDEWTESRKPYYLVFMGRMVSMENS